MTVKRISPFQIFLVQFKSLIIWTLIVAGVISGVLGERIDAIAILAIVVLNAVIGFYQEYSAEKSIAALKKMAAPHAKLRRDGQITSIPAAGIVEGDVLALEAGDLIAADARLLSAASLKCIESALTGESNALKKHRGILEQDDIPLGDRENMLFMGTSVAAGTGEAVVVATAMETELGRIAGLIETAGNEKTPLQKKLDSFGRILVWATLGSVLLLFVIGMLRGTPLMELFMTSVSLAVAAVPEGLPAIVTVALSRGVMRMSRHHALVRKLAAVETLGATTVITAVHKLRIIRAWKANEAVVTMTGDGVNNAPAIKRSEIGIAMGISGTEVTKQASDMIITDDDFATIVAAVKQGRGICNNIRKTLQYLLAGNTGELLLMMVCVIIGLPTLLLPIHLLWINLVTDSLPALCLATDPSDPDVMKRSPRPPSE